MRVFKIAVAAACAFAVVTVSPAEAATSRSISLTVPASLLTSTSFTFKGKVTRSPKGSTVTLQRKSGSSWKAVKTVKTSDTAGNFSSTATSMSTANTYSYRAYAPKTSKLAAAASSTKKIVVRKKVSVLNFAADTLFPAPSTPVTFSGKVSPWVSGTPVKLYSRAGTSGSFVSPVTVTPNSTGTFSRQVTPPASQVTQYRIVVSLTSKYSSATSSTLTVDTRDPLITTTVLADGTKDTVYTQALSNRGNRSGTWTVTTGNLPTGLSIVGSDLTGTPTATGPSTFKLQFTDSANRVSPEVEYSMLIDGTASALTHAQMSVGATHVCRLKTDANLHCWGKNLKGELGVGATGFDPVRVPTLVTTPASAAAGTGWASVSAGLWTHTCALRTDFTAWCWGDGSHGELGNTDGAYHNEPQASASGLHFKQIATGLTHTCAIRTDDQLWCWGTWGSSSGPPSVVSGPGVPTSWSQVDAGSGYTCAIDSNHKLWCWGADFRGWLGVGDTAGRSAPTRVNIGANDTDWKQVTTGQGHTCAIAFADNKLYCWGKNSHGNLGEGTTTDRTSPQAVATTGLIPDAWDSVSAGGLGNDDHTCAVGDNGTLWCWGTNLNGELGNGLVDSTFPVDPNQEHTIPTKVGLETTWESVAIGGAQVCGVQTDATTWCWGSNASGQIGQNSFIANYPAPIQVN